IAGGVTAIVINNEINGGGSDTSEISVTIPEGASTSSVAQALKDAGLISSRSVFRLYSRIHGADGTFQFGEKILNRSMSYDEMIEVLQAMSMRQVETFSLTVPEGTTALRLAIMLEELGICTRQEFVEACNSGSYDVGFWDEISQDENKFIRLEGYLFPDTYEFEVGSSLQDIILKMLRNFETRVLTEERSAAIAASGYTLEKIITLSSIVEKESVGDESYPMVAGVFFNRLNNPDLFPCLESDTSCDWRRRGLGDLEDYYGGYFPGVLQYYYGGYENVPAGTLEGYDTFSYPGIIIGAICNPGLKSIDGVLEPAEHDYFFFFTGEDKETFYWSRTADEHASQYALYGPA
ncbi:MAG: endolytic transglycosylase MltG, partial [Oscillospiraceae bacterium]|nr:endolytic transglycosylase MltG [Oscillospiraceae bacterium]